MNSNIIKIYKFSLNSYKKYHNRILSSVIYISAFLFIIAAFLVFLVARVPYRNLSFSAFNPLWSICLLLFVALLYMWQPIRKLYLHFRGDKALFNNDVSISTSGSEVCITVHFRNHLHDVYYRIKNINALKHNKYIEIEGEIEAEFIYDKDMPEKVKKRLFHREKVDRIEHRKNLRIPAYFENMDEIYASLIKFKERTADKQ